jgi:hypothetical protein
MRLIVGMNAPTIGMATMSLDSNTLLLTLVSSCGRMTYEAQHSSLMENVFVLLST